MLGTFQILSFSSGVFLGTDSSTLPSATSQELSSALCLLVSAYTPVAWLLPGPLLSLPKDKVKTL